jgi:hypothetical protein
VALEFDGTGTVDLVDCGTDTSIENIFAGGGTAMGWIRLTSFEPNIDVIVTKCRDFDGFGLCDDGWAFGPTGFGGWDTVWFDQAHGASQNQTWRAPFDVILVDTWYHLAVTYDNTNTSNDPLLYLDGVSQTVTQTTFSGQAANSDAGYPCYLGATVDTVPASRSVINGKLADVRLYTRILTAAEIQTIYACRGTDAIVDDLVARWLLNGVHATSPSGAGAVADVGPFGNDGTPAGAPDWSDDVVQRARRIYG